MMNFTARIPAVSFGLRSDHYVLGFPPKRSREIAFSRFFSPDSCQRFDAVQFESMRQWWEAKEQEEALLVTGPCGCGKQAFLEQFLARVNVPVVRIACGRAMMRKELLPEEAGCCYGPVSSALTQGAVLWLDDLAYASDAVRDIALELVHAREQFCLRSGQVLQRHPDARVLLTLTEGAQSQEDNSWLAAMRSSCWLHRHDYLGSQDEIAMVWSRLQDRAQGVPQDFARCLCACCVGFGRRTRAQATDAKKISLPVLGHAGVIRLALLLMQWVQEDWRRVPDILERAVSFVVAGGCPPAARAALQQLAHFAFSELGKAQAKSEELSG